MSEEAEEKRSLWMLVCDTGYVYEMFPLYATSKEDAERQAEQLIRETPRTLVFVDLLAYPHGLIIYRSHFPGSI